MSVILSTGGVSAPWHAGIYTTPDQRQTPPDERQTPPQTKGRHPPDQRQTPPPPGIRSMSGRYASYWNAFFSCFTYLLFLSVNRNPPSPQLPPIPRFMMTSSTENMTQSFDDTRSAFKEIKPKTPKKLKSPQDQLTSQQKCMTSYHRLMTPPYSTTTSQIKDEPETVFVREKKPPPEGVISPVFYPIPIHPSGQCNC